VDLERLRHSLDKVTGRTSAAVTGEPHRDQHDE